MTKVHFFVLESKEGRKSFLTLPGQTVGRGRPVTPGIIVKPCRDVEALFRKYKKECPGGTFFFTRSLRKDFCCCFADNIYPVSELYREEDVSLFSDKDKIRQEWEKYKSVNL